MTGAIITLAVVALLEPSHSPDTASPAAEVAELTGGNPVSSNSFQFYTLLNELEVAIPDSAAASAAESESTVYWLQAGSFRRLEDADRMRASLILLNLEASLSQVNYQGNLWHRVMVGPFASRTQMASARGKLLEQNIQPLLLMEREPNG